MYITNKTKQYPCTGYFPTADNVRFIVEGVTLPITGEIKLVSEDNNLVLSVHDCSDYARQVYENGVLILTNEPVPSPPTLTELRKAKLNSLEGKCSGAIYYGIDIGALHYNFTEKSQINLSEIAGWVRDGQTSFLYRADNEPSQRLYAVEEIRAVITAKGEWKAVNTLYYELLKVWINRETNETTLASISYGSTLPTDLLTELSTKLASVGIDLSKYASAFN